MKRQLLLVAAIAALAGCRNTCGNTSGWFNRSSCNAPTAMPVSNPGPAAVAYPTTYPASFSTPLVSAPRSYPVIPPPGPGTVELPYPNETIPPTVLPTGTISNLPNGNRGVGLPR